MEKNKLKVAVIRQELVELTGDAIAALILNQAIYHHHAIADMDNSTQEFIEKLEKQGAKDLAEQAKRNLRNGWFYKSPNSFYKEIMISSRSTVMRRLAILVKMGYIIKGGQNLGFADVDDTWWKVNIPKIRRDLAKLGYTLHGYPIWQEELEEEEDQQGSVHGEQGGVHGEQGGVHGEQGGVHGEHHQKNTTKITTKEDSKDFFSSSEIIEINLDLKKKYPDAPFDHIKENVLSDTTLIIKTKKQYQAILEYRLKHFKPKGEKKKSSHNTRKPIRKELIPEYMKPGYETKTIDTMTPEERTEFEKKKKDLEKRLEKYKK